MQSSVVIANIAISVKHCFFLDLSKTYFENSCDNHIKHFSLPVGRDFDKHVVISEILVIVGRDTLDFITNIY